MEKNREKHAKKRPYPPLFLRNPRPGGRFLRNKGGVGSFDIVFFLRFFTIFSRAPPGVGFWTPFFVIFDEN